MTLSSDQYAPRGLDAMLIVYSLLGNHPASDVCEAFIRERASWFTTTLTLLEAKAILTKVYAVMPILSHNDFLNFPQDP
ncbi:hypothetical protein J4G08_18450 [Candidatus Poribacteria bacterium]|nr:hypothetical protein [Candidatus Poribacteria bacterium]